MTYVPERVPDLLELAEDVKRIEEIVVRMDDKLDQRFVPRELYEAKHEALRNENNLAHANFIQNMEAMRLKIEAVEKAADRKIAALAEAADRKVDEVKKSADRKIEAVEAACDRKVSSIEKRTQWMMGIMATPIIGVAVAWIASGGLST